MCINLLFMTVIIVPLNVIMLYPIGRKSGIYASHDIALVLEVINDNYILSTEALNLVHLNTMLWLAM
jgi:hypothetical protein